MSIRTTISAAAAALAALFLVALAPSGAAAHGGHSGQKHAHAAPSAGGSLAVKDAGTRSAVSAEIRAPMPASAGDRTDAECGDRGCCSAGHCSGCGTALAPASWICLDLPPELLLLNPVSARPSSLAREGPPRPPKFFA